MNKATGNSISHSLSKMEQTAPSTRGALAGFRGTCSCGFVVSTSLEMLTLSDFKAHVAYATKAVR